MASANDEQYPFYTDRNFLYLTGLDSKEFVLLAWKDSEGNTGSPCQSAAPGKYPDTAAHNFPEKPAYGNPPQGRESISCRRI